MKGTTFKALRLRDGDPSPTAADVPEPRGFTGLWVNTDAGCQGPARLELVSRDGASSLRTWGPGERTPTPWQDLDFYAGISTAAPLAFTARQRFGAYEGLLHGNLNLGLLVLGTYKTFADGRGPGYFSREFLVRRRAAGTGEEADPGTPGELFADVEQPAAVEIEPMLGRWRNAEAGSRGIAEIAITDGPAGAEVRVFGSGAEGPVDWGPAEVGVYASVDEGGTPTLSLLARYDLGFLTSELQLRVPGGTLALANFNAFGDAGGRRDYFTREFFYREEPPVRS